MSHHKDDSLGARNHVTYVPTTSFTCSKYCIGLKDKSYQALSKKSTTAPAKVRRKFSDDAL